jgi:hypothetical protein
MSEVATADTAMDVLIGQYVKLRDRIEQVDAAHKEKMKPAREMLESLNNQILDALNKTGGKSISTANGTAYRTAKSSASIEDAVSFRDYVIANELWEMLDWRANKTAVEEHLKDYEAPPPGVKFSSVFVVGVRRPAKD